MTGHHDRPKPPKRVGEPAQVYLTESDQARLDRLMRQLDASKSDVLRKGLEALELQLVYPASHPANRLIGLADELALDGMDAARDHDRVLSDAEAESWREQSDGA